MRCRVDSEHTTILRLHRYVDSLAATVITTAISTAHAFAITTPILIAITVITTATTVNMVTNLPINDIVAIQAPSYALYSDRAGHGQPVFNADATTTWHRFTPNYWRNQIHLYAHSTMYLWTRNYRHRII